MKDHNQLCTNVKQFLHFTKCPNLDELVSLEPAEVGGLITEWEILLRTGLNRKHSTIENKLQCLQIFFKVNGIRVNFTEDDRYENYY